MNAKSIESINRVSKISLPVKDIIKAADSIKEYREDYLLKVQFSDRTQKYFFDPRVVQSFENLVSLMSVSSKYIESDIGDIF